MGVRSRAGYDFLERNNLESHEPNPESAMTDAATNRGSVTHNGKISLVADHPHPTDRRAAEPAANMANDVLTQPETRSLSDTPNATGRELDSFLGNAFEEKPVWVGLWESIRDVFFPPKLPPLELTSTPIP